MRALDTNIIVRLLVNDSPEQAMAAQSIIADPCFLAPTVLLEAAWVLRSSYRFDRQNVATALSAILDYPSIQIENEPEVRWALKRHGEVASDLADLLHLAYSINTDRFTTFDQRLAAQAGSDAPVTVELAR